MIEAEAVFAAANAEEERRVMLLMAQGISIGQIAARLGVTEQVIEQHRYNIFQLQPGMDRLSPREQEVARLIADGLMTKQIAFRLGLSCKTIGVHRYNLMRKLGAHNVAQVIRLTAG